MDELMMQRCLELANNALGTTYPNPLVGSVIVHNQKIIGEGWHKKAGQDHAEIVAIKSVNDKSLLKESTLYVNLEPCSHFGKTPPCSHKIVEYGIPKVVIGIRDKASHVNGKGIAYLKENGVEVIEHILEEEAEWLNRRFFTFHTKNRPYIVLKFAQTSNGYFAPLGQEQKWITNTYCKQLAHKWRTEEASILVGKRTAEIDQPQLNARLWLGNQPIRVIISRELSPEIKSFLSSDLKTIVFTEAENEKMQNVDFIKIDFEVNVLEQILHHLHEQNLQSIIVEGGATTLAHFIEENLWDEARVFTGDVAWENGIKSPILENARIKFQQDLGRDEYKLYVNRKQ